MFSFITLLGLPGLFRGSKRSTLAATLTGQRADINTMPKKNKNIPVNSMTDNFSQGISIDKVSIKKADFKTAEQYEEAKQSHRDEGHTFHIVEKGTVHIEIDFQKYKINAPAVVYMHPNQVHRVLDFTSMTVCSLAIKNENLNADYLKFLEEITPAKPLALTKNSHSNIFETFSLCLDFSTQKSNRLYLSRPEKTLQFLLVILFFSLHWIFLILILPYNVN